MIRKITPVLAAALMLGTAATPAASQEDPAAVKQAVKDLRDEYFATYGANAPEKAASLFASNGVLLPPTTGPIRGPDQVREWLGGFIGNQEAVSLSAMSEETLVAGDRVVDRGILTLEVTPSGADQSSSDTGKYVLVAEKARPEEGAEAVWRIRWLIWNTDHPLRTSGGGEEG